MRILLTGVAGLIGSWLSDALCADPAVEKLIGVDDLSGGLMQNVNVSRSPKFIFEQIDIRDKFKINEVCAAHRPHVIVHAAACAREGASAFQPVKIVETNMMISTILAEAGIRHGMTKFVFFSSMAVMGNQKPPFVEDMPMSPVDPYGISKAATESIIHSLAEVHGFKWSIVRPHNCFGERQALFDPYRNVAGIWMNRIMRNEPLYLFGNKTKRAFSYMEDCTPAMARVVLTDKTDGQVVFIGGKEEILVEDLLNEVLEQFKDYPQPEIKRVPLRPLEVPVAFCSTEKSVKLLGYEEKIGWKAGVAKMATWAKQQGPQGWKWDKLPLSSEKMPIPWKN